MRDQSTYLIKMLRNANTMLQLDERTFNATLRNIAVEIILGIKYLLSI